MLKKRYIIIVLGVVSVLLGSLFVSNIILAQSGGIEYDPWLDYNDDGIIDVKDLSSLGQTYGTSGEPINKTALLLELLSRVEALEANFPVTTDKIADGNVTNAKLAAGAIVYNTTSAKVFSSKNTETWEDFPSMSVTIALERTSELLVLFTTNVRVFAKATSVQWKALINQTEASPGAVALQPSWELFSSVSFNFYKSSIGAGTYTVKIQWYVYNGAAQAYARSLIVIALPA